MLIVLLTCFNHTDTVVADLGEQRPGSAGLSDVGGVRWGVLSRMASVSRAALITPNETELGSGATANTASLHCSLRDWERKVPRSIQSSLSLSLLFSLSQSLHPLSHFHLLVSAAFPENISLHFSHVVSLFLLPEKSLHLIKSFWVLNQVNTFSSVVWIFQHTQQEAQTPFVHSA